jgi:hypothetical protein
MRARSRSRSWSRRIGCCRSAPLQMQSCSWGRIINLPSVNESANAASNRHAQIPLFGNCPRWNPLFGELSEFLYDLSSRLRLSGFSGLHPAGTSKPCALLFWRLLNNLQSALLSGRRFLRGRTLLSGCALLRQRILPGARPRPFWQPFRRHELLLRQRVPDLWSLHLHLRTEGLRAQKEIPPQLARLTQRSPACQQQQQQQQQQSQPGQQQQSQPGQQQRLLKTKIILLFIESRSR